MPKFTLICDNSCDLDTHVVRHEFTAETYWDVIQEFETFLRGAGYSFDGVIDIVDPIDDVIVNVDTVQHSFHFYDTERNK